ncbi:glycosyltransferase [Candidatus Sumerlaeota bacterium]|nr:glycosyltransferase [Candidatus Sumerlaeota bacterium]
MDEPFFSIVIPVRNEADRIASCLESVFKNRGTDIAFDVTVVDNGSTDETVEAARRAGARVVLNPDARRGYVAQSRNLGARESRGKIVAFLDGDMAVPPDWLTRAKEYYDQDFEGVLSFPQRAPDDAAWVGRVWESRNHRDRRRGVSTINVSSANMFINRGLFEKVGGFDERLGSCEDRDLAFRVRAAGHQSIRLPGPRLVHLGCDRNVRELIRKEAWRQSAALQFAVKHRWHLRVWRNPVFSLYHVVLGILFAVAVCLRLPVPALVAAALWLLPTFVLGTFIRTGNLSWPDRARLVFLLWVRWNVAGLVLLARIPSLFSRQRPDEAVKS